MRGLGIAALVAALAIAETAKSAEASDADKAIAKKLVEASQKQVCEMLKDCDSAKFRYGKVVQNKGKFITCGEVNAKNSYGGYGGYEIWMQLVPATTPPTMEEDLPEEMKLEIHSGPCGQPNPRESG